MGRGMGKMGVMLLSLVLTTMLSACMPKESEEKAKVIPYQSKEDIFYRNPLGVSAIGDPFILKASDGKYYLYATSDAGSGFKVWVSEDMLHWQVKPMKAYSKSADTWGNKDFWAPEVYEWDGKYHMYYSAFWKEKKSLRMGHAVSDHPEGPFVDVSGEPMFDLGYAVIDGHVFIDDDGRAYLYYSRDCSENVVVKYHESHIYGVELDKDKHSFLGEPKLLLMPSEEWELNSGDYRWNEGPYVVKYQGKYYMHYSGNFYGSRDYSVGYAVSDSPLGEYQKGVDSRLAYAEKEWKKISGSGHNMLIPIADTPLYYSVYHTHTIASIGGGDRSLNIDIVGIRPDGRMFSNGPTTSKVLKPEVFERSVALYPHYNIRKEEKEIAALKDFEFALYQTKPYPAEEELLEPGKEIMIQLDKSYLLEAVLLYNGKDKSKEEKIEIVFSNRTKMEALSFPKMTGEPLSIDIAGAELEWIKIINSGQETLSLSEVMLIPSK